MLKTFMTCLAFLFAIQSTVQCLESMNKLTKLFTETHDAKLIEQSELNVRAKRDAADYNYHAHNDNDSEHSLNLMAKFQKSTDSSININNFATTALKVSEQLLSAKFNKNKANNQEEVLKVLQAIKAPSKFCPFEEQVVCDPDFPYRSLDGSCNNLKNKWWGKAGTPFKRWMSADYSDTFKLNEPRAASDGSELPNARLLSCALGGDFHDIEKSVTHMLMQWGQLVNHDITSLSITREDDPDQSICKSCTKTHKCLPIMIESNTTCNCIKTMSHDCIEFTRSSASFGDIACTLGPREQINLQTAFLDGSHIYGSTPKEMEQVRDRINNAGLLKVQKRTNNVNEDLLPMETAERPGDCLDFKPTTKCFMAGDDRVNQNPALMSMHTIFAREHNRIARILKRLNPLWNDEVVFHEARRIVIAQIQQITYNEYLPILLGDKVMNDFRLRSGTGAEKIKIYDPNVDPRVTNEYSASAGRFGHSMIRTDYSRLDSDYKSTGLKSFLLRNSYFRANDLYDREEGGLETILRGMLHDPLMKADTWFTSEITQHLFETKNKMSEPFHFDLVSINIARGRDHGIKGYTKFREFCGLEPVNTWADMRRFVDNSAVNIYEQFFKGPEDVDLFLAGLAEIKKDNSLLGPTFGCLLGLQFQSMKFGDRFWYETAEAPADFTSGQLMELRKTSLAKILCKNMNNTPKIQPFAFISSNEQGNELVDCSSLLDIDWRFWQSS